MCPTFTRHGPSLQEVSPLPLCTRQGRCAHRFLSRRLDRDLFQLPLLDRLRRLRYRWLKSTPRCPVAGSLFSFFMARMFIAQLPFDSHLNRTTKELPMSAQCLPFPPQLWHPSESCQVWGVRWGVGRAEEESLKSGNPIWGWSWLFLRVHNSDEGQRV